MDAHAPFVPAQPPLTANRGQLASAGLGRSLLVTLLTGLLGISVASCSRQPNADRVINVEDTDQEMNAAIEKARASLPSFWQAFDHHEPGESDFSLKVRITDSHGTEHFWTSDIERKDGKVFGTINNDPDIVKNVKIGDRVEIPEADISDWMFLREDKMVGNYTIRVLLKQMPAQEAEYYKQRLADP
jgi:uncharacterized protein YegJ (DUF2314 family)